MIGALFKYVTQIRRQVKHVMATKYEIQMEVIDALVEEFRKRWEMQDDDEEMIAAFKASFLQKATDEAGKKKKKTATTPAAGEPKPKRPPSEYNLFVQAKTDELKAAGFKGHDIFREAAKLWKQRPAEAATA